MARIAGGKVLVVAQDGSGHFTNVQAAIDTVPLRNNERITIDVLPGVYRQPIYVPKTKNMITLRGFCAEDTVLTWNNTATRIEHHQATSVIGTGTFGCGTVIVQTYFFWNHLWEWDSHIQILPPTCTIMGTSALVGNPIVDDYYDSIGRIQYWWTVALISDATYNNIMKNCNFKQQNFSTACQKYLGYALNTEFGNIDQSDIYTPVCTQPIARSRKSFPRRIAGYDPCIENYAEIYYNRPDVQTALHANTTHIPYNWTGLSETFNTNWTDSEFSILPIYTELIAAGLKIWVYSGDVDTKVPVTSTRVSLNQLSLPVKIPWYPWYLNNQTVGGWTEVYEGLTFATVRGAGHEVPHFQPERALKLFQSFITGHSLPATVPTHT